MTRAWIFVALWTAGCSAHAQVLEIGDDGRVRRIDVSEDVEAAPSGVANVASSPATIPGSVPARYRDALQTAATRYEVSPWLIDAVARSESGYDADAVSPAGAIGIMQLMPATAHALGVDPYDPTQNILGGTAYLRQLLDRFGGSVDLALAAYNAGARRVERHGGVPPYRETRDYIGRNFERLAAASERAPDAGAELPRFSPYAEGGAP